MVLAIKEDIAVGHGWGLETIRASFVPVQAVANTTNSGQQHAEEPLRFVLAGFQPRFSQWDPVSQTIRSGYVADVRPPGLSFELRLSTTAADGEGGDTTENDAAQSGGIYECPVFSTILREKVILTIRLPCDPAEVAVLQRHGACAVLHS
jgi:hypothetical protein